MAYSSLAEFLEELSEHQELARVSAEVDPALELPEIARRCAERAGPALLFDRVRGSGMAVLVNLLATEGRACRALGLESLDQLAERIDSLIERNTPRNWFDRLKTNADEAGVNKFRPKQVKSAPCQQIVRLGRDIDLGVLPWIQAWLNAEPSLAGVRLLIPKLAGEGHDVLVCSISPIDGARLRVTDEDQGEIQRRLAQHRDTSERVTAALLVGGDPAASAAAYLDIPAEADPLHIVGLVRGKSLEVVKCRTHDLEVPADCELVIEGYFELRNASAVEQNGDAHFIDAANPFQVTALTHRSHPIVPVTLETGSRGESAVLLLLRERMLLPAVRAIAPDVVDLHVPHFGGGRSYAFVALRKRYPHQARQVAAALWGSNMLRHARFVVVVDETHNVHNVEAVLASISQNVVPERDVFWLDAPAHPANRANTLGGLARHVAIDATSKVPAEDTSMPANSPQITDQVRQLVTARWREYKLEAESP
jgi:4-hydroxy-3-polyprenylbenzoate decarboxylase